MVFSLFNLYTSCLQAGWSYQHTMLHKQTSCHPWHHHTTWCAITAGMFPELVFSYLCGNMRDFCIVLFHVFIFNSFFWLCFECWQGAENWAPKYTNPVSFLGMIVDSGVVMKQQSLSSVPLQTTDQANPHISRCVSRNMWFCWLCGWGTYSLWVARLSITCLFSGWRIFSSVVNYIAADAGQSTESYMSSECTSLLVSPCIQDVGAEEVVLVWLIHLFSHTFSLDYQLLSTQS